MTNTTAKNIVIIEDDISISNMLENQLREVYADAKIEHAQDSEKAWQILNRRQATLIILDWKLPDTTGLSILNQIRADNRLKYIPILVQSGYLDQEDLMLIGELQFTEYLSKPTKSIQIKTKIAQITPKSLQI